MVRNDAAKRRRVKVEEPMRVVSASSQVDESRPVPVACQAEDAEGFGEEFDYGSDFLLDLQLIPMPSMELIPGLLLGKMQSEDVEQVTEALDQLKSLMDSGNDGSKSNTKKAFQHGAPSLIILTMNRFQHHEVVQLNATHCLQLLASTAMNATVILQSGGVECVVNGLLLLHDRCDRFKSNLKIDIHTITDASLYSSRQIGLCRTVVIEDIIVITSLHSGPGKTATIFKPFNGING